MTEAEEAELTRKTDEVRLEDAKHVYGMLKTLIGVHTSRLQNDGVRGAAKLRSMLIDAQVEAGVILDRLERSGGKVMGGGS